MIATGGGPEGIIRRAGKDFLVAFATAARSLKLYPLENDQVQRAIDELEHTATVLHEEDAVLEVRVTRDVIFVNGVRLRVDLDNYASFNQILKQFDALGLGRMVVDHGVDRGQWQTFLSLLLESASQVENEDAAVDLLDQLGRRGITHIVVDGASDDERDIKELDQDVQLAKRTYERTVAVTRDVVNSVRLGRGTSVRKLKRAVQGIVDQVLNNEVSLLGLTTLRDYDEYTFTHSVNVCIFAVALGRRLELSKHQLYDLGVAALMHDIGKSRVPLDILNKSTGLNDDEWRALQDHPGLGVLTLFTVRSGGDIPYRAMIAAYEHHMRGDTGGYPKAIRPRTPTLFSKIVAVVDGYDAATSRRSYQTTPLSPAAVLREMWSNPGRGYDRVLVKELVNLVGVYPIGTGVVLDTREVAIVHAPGGDPERLNRPIVRIVCDAHGVTVPTPEYVDLSETNAAGDFVRSIMRVTPLEAFGLNPVEFFT